MKENRRRTLYSYLLLCEKAALELQLLDKTFALKQSKVITHSLYCLLCVNMSVYDMFVNVCLGVYIFLCMLKQQEPIQYGTCIDALRKLGSDPDNPSSCYLGIQKVFCLSISILDPCRGELGLLTFCWDLTWVMQFCQAFSGS